MSLANPIAFIFAAVLPVIVALYLLKLRRKKKLVSTTFFWAEMVQDLQANVPFQKLRWNILLFLQLLIALAVIAAMLNLAIRGSLNEGQRTIFIVDSSASMGTMDGGQSRLQRVVGDIRSYSERLARREQVMIIDAGEHTQTILDFTSNIPEINRALDSITTHDARTDIATAFALATAKAATIDKPMIVVASDFSGVNPDIFSKSEYPFKILPVSSTGKNVAITDMSVAGVSQTDEGVAINVFLVLKNYLDQQVNANIEFRVDDALVDVRTFQVGAGERDSKLFKDIPFTIAQGAPGVLEARLQMNDDLAVDNAAWVIPAPDETMSVLLAGDDPFLSLVLSGLPGIKLFQMSQAEYKAGGDFDLTFFSGWAPETIPEGSYIFFNPPNRDYLPVSVGAAVQNPKVTDWDDGHPLMRFVNPGSFNVFSASKLEVKPGSVVLIDSNETPLMVYGERNYLRSLVIPFDLGGSTTDLVTRPTFPILMLNMISFYRSFMNASSTGLRTEGIGATTIEGGGEKVRVKGPNGFDQEFPIDAGHAFIDVDHVGIYKAQVDGADVAAKTMVANFFDETESDITATSPPTGAGGTEARRFEVKAERRIWKWLSILALMVLTIEWTFYHRKGF